MYLFIYPVCEGGIYFCPSDDDVVAPKADVLATRRDVHTICSDVSAIRSDVTVIRSDVTVIRSDVTAIRSDVPATCVDVGVKRKEVSVTREKTGVYRVEIPVRNADKRVNVGVCRAKRREEIPEGACSSIRCLQQFAGQKEDGESKVDDQSGYVYQRGNKGGGGSGRVEAESLQHEWNHGTGERAPKYDEDQ